MIFKLLLIAPFAKGENVNKYRQIIPLWRKGKWLSGINKMNTPGELIKRKVIAHFLK